MTTLRPMTASELVRISEIDRSEHITQQYASGDQGLSLVEVDIEAPRWGEAGEHPVQHYVDQWGAWLEEGGVLIGAFDSDRLVGMAVYGRSFPSEPAVFVSLYVSRSHRRHGIGAALSDEVVRLARMDGAERLYVSATPTRGTVDFYRSKGFEVLAEPNEELLALEPDDVHMAMRFQPLAS